MITTSTLEIAPDATGMTKDEQQPTFYERCALTRWGAYLTEVDRKLILDGLSLAGPPGQALDIGCDGGRWSRLLAEFGWRLTCTEINDSTLQVCKARIPEAQCLLVKGTDKKLPCGAGSMQLILCIEVWPLVHLDWFLAEIGRILEAGGILLITCSNRLSWRGLYSTVRGTDEQYYAGTYTAWKQKLLRNGVKVEREEGYAWFPFPQLSESKLIPVCGEVERVLRLSYLTALSPRVAVIARKI
jgi:SAM-dependent methyltransferase